MRGCSLLQSQETSHLRALAAWVVNSDMVGPETTNKTYTVLNAFLGKCRSKVRADGFSVTKETVLLDEVFSRASETPDMPAVRVRLMSFPLKKSTHSSSASWIGPVLTGLR